MTYDSRFGPNAQTSEQRASVLAKLLQVNPTLTTHAAALAQQLYERYVRGELTWGDVRRVLDDEAGHEAGAPRPRTAGHQPGLASWMPSSSQPVEVPWLVMARP